MNDDDDFDAQAIRTNLLEARAERAAMSEEERDPFTEEIRYLFMTVGRIKGYGNVVEFFAHADANDPDLYDKAIDVLLEAIDDAEKARGR